ncbi:MAG: type II secretion system F family protein [Vampirovibrionales bacterium]|nr:type II secretion system F family protein [Vampirovibrionales bacterium]
MASSLPVLAGLLVLTLAASLYFTFFSKSDQATQRFETTFKKQDNSPQRSAKVIAAEKFILKKVYDGSTKQSQTLSKLALKLEQANIAMAPHEFQTLTFLAAALSGVLGFLAHQNMLLGVGWAVSVWFIPDWFVSIKAWLRLAKAEEQFSDVLDAMISCLKTGFGFNQAVHSITENFEDPWGTEFGKMAIEIGMGQSKTTVLRNLYRRIPNTDVELFTTAMQIYFESGGNLVELLGNLSTTIRTRYKLFRKIRTLSAQGKLSAGMITCIPFFLMSFMALIIPEAVHGFIAHPLGMILLGLTGIWMLFGIFILFKTVQIEV